MPMLRKPTYAGTIEEKDSQDIFYWAIKKTPFERLAESWRLHCLNNGVRSDIKLDKSINQALLRNDKYI